MNNSSDSRMAKTMRTGDTCRVNSDLSSTCCTSNGRDQARRPLHSKMIHLMFTLAALPATIDAVVTGMAPTMQTNAMALLNTARLMREHRLNTGGVLSVDNDDVHLERQRVAHLQKFSRSVSVKKNGVVETPSLLQRTAVQAATTKKFNINQFISSDDLIWGEALFDDSAADTAHVLVAHRIKEGTLDEKDSTLENREIKEGPRIVDRNDQGSNLGDAAGRQNIMKADSKRKSSNFDMKKIRTKDISTIMSTKKALSDKNMRSDDNDDDIDDSSPSTARVSHKEELQLAHIVQRGVEVNRLKAKFEKTNNRDITRQEWTDLAKLDSPRELRRLVSNYRQAKNKLVMANMGLVHAVVRGRLNASGLSRSGISYEELVQEGSLGLLRAAELFDPSKGLRFSTYATIWIKGVLGNSSLGEAITLPLREKNKWRKIQKAVEELSIENNDKPDGNGRLKCRPSHEDIATRGGMRSEEVKKVMSKMKRAQNVLSLDYQYNTHSRSGTESQDYQTAFSNDKNLMDDVDLVEKLQLRTDVVAALSRNLDPREAHLMRLRYGLKDGKTRTIEECAKTMGISKARVQQLAVGCLKKLREADDAQSLQEYLLSVA